MKSKGKPVYLTISSESSPFGEIILTRNILKSSYDFISGRIYIVDGIIGGVRKAPMSITYMAWYQDTAMSDIYPTTKNNEDSDDEWYLEFKLQRYHNGFEMNKIKFVITPFKSCKLAVFFDTPKADILRENEW